MRRLRRQRGILPALARGKVAQYWSDFKDAFALQCIASWIFLYFACLSPIITFGGLLGQATGNNIAAMESLMSGFLCGVIYGLFSGQPLTILGSTGPVLVFESIVYEFCLQRDWDYLPFRLWIGVWIGIILLIMVAIDASAFVCYITRFTEENFATLIAFIFIYKVIEHIINPGTDVLRVILSKWFANLFPTKNVGTLSKFNLPHAQYFSAVENVLHIGRDFPINTSGSKKPDYNCSCEPVDGISYDGSITWSSIGKDECLISNGTLVGEGCSTPLYVPDVFLMSIVLFLGTFIISVELKDFKNALFFPSKVLH
ncbi:unnamed protein product [Timema podura]|uniref:Bicarbonate transporter-like transmembrane domain-containing protein n=1 Tax=Timema podura TaxID=61482 RepID=A0ABN7NB36_TIMPD|nr:unnamed protein product [Timema podura]